MARSNSTNGNAPRNEAVPADDASLEQQGPQLKDPRSVSAIDNIGVDDQADLLDVILDEEPGDRDANGRSFADDVRSDAPHGIRESGEG